MRTKWWVGAVFVVALLVAAGAWALDSGIAGARHASNRSGLASSTTEPVKVSGAAAASGGGDVSSSGEQPSPSSVPSSLPSPAQGGKAAKATRPSWNPQPQPSETARLEMPTATPGESPGLPKSKKRKPAISSVPKTGTAQGKLTKDFPVEAVPVPDGAKISRSSVSSQGKRVLVGLEGRSTTSPATVLGFYDHEFKDRGWMTTVTRPEKVASTLHASFGRESVVVSARRLPTGQTAFTVAGAFRPKR